MPKTSSICLASLRTCCSQTASTVTMSSLSNIWKTKHRSIQMKVRVYQTLVLSILLYASEMWTSLATDMRAIESFHMKCQ